jgi:hypothetical protein
MFANSQGGILLLGIDEQRDRAGQPTGTPAVNQMLGLDLQNPESLLLSYDARVLSSIEDRLPLESVAIPLANGSYVLAIRVPNSLTRPHCVRHEGHVYFPARRERQRYNMDVREIKEMVLQSASRVEGAGRTLAEGLLDMPAPGNDSPSLIAGVIPVFAGDFAIDLRNPDVIQAVGKFSITKRSIDAPMLKSVLKFEFYRELHGRKPLKEMVGTRRLELLTSTVSR